MGFKENLRSELQYQGILVKELAAKTGIKKQTLDNYLSSHNSTPNAETAIKIARALNTTVEALFDNSSETEKEKIIRISSIELEELINLYRKMSEEKKKAVLEIMRLI